MGTSNKILPIAFLMIIACRGLAYAQDLRKDFPDAFKVRIQNPMKAARANAIVIIPESDIVKQNPEFNSRAFVVLDKDKEIPSQFNSKDSDTRGIVVVMDLPPGKKDLTVRFNKAGEYPRKYQKKTQAELSHKFNGEWKNREYIGGDFKNVNYLRVPKEHKDHSWFIRYEGPGWESDKVGYRFYLDQRNATDVYGKTVHEPILQMVGLDGFESYHHMQPWGMDVMKTGKALGVGSIGAWLNDAAIRVELTDSVTSQIDENGNVYSSILTKYYGWKVGPEVVNLTSRLSIHAGTRLTDNRMTLSKDLTNMCTGLVKDEKARLFKKEGDSSSWGYIASFGPQSLNKDNLGIAVLFKPSSFAGFAEDKYSNIVKLKSSGKTLEYYFFGAWEGEPEGIKTETEFLDYLNKSAQELASPLRVEVLKVK
jgi:hypothetical protein